jgi:hypothetical protein
MALSTARPRAWTGSVVGAALVVVLVVVLVVAAAVTRRAEPEGTNRPVLPPDPLAGSCWPLPTERHFGFAYQVRADDRTVRDGERRRVLTVQYDQVDAEDVRADIADLLASAGFVPASPGEFTEPGYGTVRFEVSRLPGLTEDSIVRGTLELDLPAAAARAEARECDQRGLGA